MWRFATPISSNSDYDWHSPVRKEVDAVVLANAANALAVEVLTVVLYAHLLSISGYGGVVSHYFDATWNSTPTSLYSAGETTAGICQ